MHYTEKPRKNARAIDCSTSTARSLCLGKRSFVIAGLTAALALPAGFAMEPAWADVPGDRSFAMSDGRKEAERIASAPSQSAVRATLDAEGEKAESQQLPPFSSLPSALLPLDRLNEQIAEFGEAGTVADSIAQGTIGQDREKLLLQRSLVKDAGYEQLKSFAMKSQDHSDFLQWFLSDYEVLRLYVTGGKPGGANPGKDHASHVRSLGQFMDIARAYPGDIESGNPDRDVYQRMMISAALGVSDTTRLWVGNENPVSDHVQRYHIIRTFRQNHERYHFQKDLFDRLPVQNMRWVFENRISNEEMPWLANYSIKKHPDNEGDRVSAWNYVDYTGEYRDHNGYSDPEFFDQKCLYEQAVSQEAADKGAIVPGGWAAKYSFQYDDPNFPNKPGEEYHYFQYDKPGEKLRLWMPFEEGGVCGALAKTTENLYNLRGTPAAEAGQPRHSICFTYRLVKDPKTGKMVPKYDHWGNAWDWLNTNLPNAGNVLCGWTPVHSVNGQSEKDNPLYKVWPGGTFTFMAQDALNDMDAFTRVWELRQLSEVHGAKGDKLAIYDKALTIQPFNLDILKAQIELYAADDKTTDEEWVSLAHKISEGCVAYPYPMHSLLVRIEQETGDDTLNFKIERERQDALRRAKSLPESESVWAKEAQEVAKRLLGEQTSQMFFFSFSGEDAGKIKLGSQFNADQVTWDYSLDGGRTWITVGQGKAEVQLTEEQIASVNAKDDIRFQVSGVGSDVSKINIVEGKAPEGISANNAQKGFYLKDGLDYDRVEILIDGEWKKLEKGMVLPANTDFKLRSAAWGTSLASKGDRVVTKRLARGGEPEGARAVSPADLSINDDPGTYGGCNTVRAIDGTVDDVGEVWETARMKTPYIQIDLGRERELTHFDWLYRGFGMGGNPFKVRVMAAGADAVPAPSAQGKDAGVKIPREEFEEVGLFSFNWGNGATYRNEFESPVRARYVRIEALSTKGSSVNEENTDAQWCEGTLSAKEITFWERDDSLKDVHADLSLKADSIELPQSEFGGTVDPVPLGIVNKGTGHAIIDDVQGVLEDGARDVEFSDVFALTRGYGEIAPASEDATWTIAPASGAPVGEHRGRVTVTYHDAKNPDDRKALELTVSHTVARAQDRAISVSLAGVTPTSITLGTATPSIGGGAVEYALSKGDAAPAEGWQAGTTFEDLERGGTYYAFARVAEDADAPAAVSAPLKVVLPRLEPRLVVEDFAFAPVTFGYEEQPRRALVIKNMGDGDAVIDDVEISDADAGEFDLKVGTAELPAGGKNASWEILAQPGLGAGAHEGVATVRYHGEGEAPGSQALDVPIALTVEKLDRDVALEVREVKPTSLKLSTSLRGPNDGAVEYALVKEDEELTDDSWKKGASFDSLTADTAYRAHARVTGGENHADAHVGPILVRTPPAEKGLSMTVPNMKPVEFGYTEAESARITLRNTGDEVVLIDAVELSGVDADKFTVDRGTSDKVEAVKGVNEGYAIKPLTGLDAGVYEAAVKVTYHGEAAEAPEADPRGSTCELHGAIRFEVAPKMRSAAVQIEAVADTTVTAAPFVPAEGSGVVSYACSPIPVAPADEGAWQQGRTFVGLDPDTAYHVFARVTGDEAGNHRDAVSAPEAVRTLPGKPTLAMSAPDFGALEYGYGEIEPVALALVNEGNGPAMIESVTVDSDEFEVVEGGSVIVPGPTDANWRIVPKKGLSAGAHRATVTVSYRSAAEGSALKTMTGEVSITVRGLDRTMTVAAAEVGADRIEAAAELSAGAGTIEYALVKGEYAPSEADWTTEPVFAGLEPETTYRLFARASGDAAYADVHADPVDVRTLRAPAGGGAGSGGATGGSGGGGATGGSGGASQGGAGQGGGAGFAPGGGAASGNGSTTAGAPRPHGGSTGGHISTGLPTTGDPATASALAAGGAGFISALAVFLRRRNRK